MNLKPLGDRIVVKPSEQEEQTASGIFLPETAKEKPQQGSIIAVVEPHRYSRVKDLFPDFCRCFKSADHVVVIPLYSAGEAPLDGISSQALAEGIRAQSGKEAATVDTVEELAAHLRDIAKSGDVIVCLGAGYSTEWAHALPGALAGGD